MDPLYCLFFVASGCSTSARLSSLVGNMKIDFAPLDLPLSRRLQTAVVLQWVFSFLGLGEFSCLLYMYLETCVNVENRWDGTVHGGQICRYSLFDHCGSLKHFQYEECIEYDSRRNVVTSDINYWLTSRGSQVTQDLNTVL